MPDRDHLIATLLATHPCQDCLTQVVEASVAAQADALLAAGWRGPVDPAPAIPSYLSGNPQVERPTHQALQPIPELDPETIVKRSEDR